MRELPHSVAHGGRLRGAGPWATRGLVVWSLALLGGGCTGSQPQVPRDARSTRSAALGRIDQCRQEIERAVHGALGSRFTRQRAARRAPGVSPRDLQAWVGSVDFAARSRALSSRLMTAWRQRGRVQLQNATQQAVVACQRQSPGRCRVFARCLVQGARTDPALAPQWKAMLDNLWRELADSSREQLQIGSVTGGSRKGRRRRAPMRSYRPDPGVYSHKIDPKKIITTKSGQRIVSNIIVLLLKRGQVRGAAESVARRVGGKIVGQIPRWDLYQIMVPTTTQAALDARIAKARRDPRVRSAGYSLIVSIR